jgi:Outer membrane lipoprotein-sorting protein
MKQVKILLFGLALCLGLAGAASAADAPDANQILASVRFSRIDRELNGQLRKQDGSVVPFTLQLNGNNMAFHFTNPDETLQLALTDSGSTLKDTADGRTHVISGRQLMDPVRGTDITYEDLALRFLYWPNARIEGEDRIKTLPCWIILTQSTGQRSSYTSVRIWVAKEGNGMLRAETYDASSKLVKRFDVLAGQRIQGVWTLKQMRIERMDPNTNRPVSRTYLEISSQ